MPSRTEPTQDEFNQIEAAVIDAVVTKYPALATGAGSALRELLIRPLAYVYAWVSVNLTKYRNEASIKYLLRSQLTENEVADAVASNFFVTRRQGSRSKGTLTLFLSTSYIQIPAYSVFRILGVSLVTTQRIVAFDTEYRQADGILYVPIVPYNTEGTVFMINIPVEAFEEGVIDIPKGSAVDSSPGGAIIEGFLSSDVTGGNLAETDAEMLTRASYSTAQYGVGSVYGIKHRLDNAPVQILDAAVVEHKASYDDYVSRSAYAINPGGTVDCYVKTGKSTLYALIAVNTIEYPYPTVEHNVKIIPAENGRDVCGFYSISSVLANGTQITNFDISFESADNKYTPEGARLSDRQAVLVHFTTDTAVTKLDVSVGVLYNAGIYELQRFMDSDINRFIGQSVMIKAAVPISLKLDCVVDTDEALTETYLQSIRECIASAVNNLSIGSAYLNFSDIREAVANTLPDVRLRLPCTVSADIPLKDGTMDTVYSSSGILDLTGKPHDNYWDPSVCYFSLLASNIRLEQA